VTAPARDLAWDGCVNVRDLGGLPAGDGRRTRFGVVVRADSRASLTEAGWGSLVGYGVSRIVDLRRADELAADPAPPDGIDVEVVHVSLMEGVEPGDPGWAEVVAAAEAASTLRDAYVVYYEAALERCRPAVAAALDAIAAAPSGAVVVHCVGGKDRTGLVAALLLRLCGVSLETIDADYAATEARLLGRFDPETAAAPAGAMAASLAGLERRHGSVEAYLAGCAPSAATIGRLRDRLLAPLEAVHA
jgi:protein tyrosine/serine phosphatase